jgi:hypothetical protein
MQLPGTSVETTIAIAVGEACSVAVSSVMDGVNCDGGSVAVTATTDAVADGDGSTSGVLEGVEGGASVGKLGRGVGVASEPQAEIQLIRNKLIAKGIELPFRMFIVPLPHRSLFESVFSARDLS